MQFAAQRTDLNLQAVDEPLVLFCQPIEDVLPHPMATLVTGITPQQALREGIPEPAFIRQIEREFSQPNTCGAGYNSIRFDDEVTRFTLYRNFYDPYGREWRNGNSRWDIIDMVRMTYALRPQLMSWPERSPGVPSFKLEMLTQANGIAHGDAHDALADVKATIDMARLIKEKDAALYDYCWKLRDKNFVLSRIDLRDHRPIIHVSSRYPAERGCLAVVLPLARLKTNANAVVVLDLEFDPVELSALTADEIAGRVFSSAAEMQEGASRIPLKLLHLNRTPMVAPVSMLSEERAQQLGIDRALCETNWQKLTDIEALKEKLEAVFSPPQFAEIDAEVALYQGFITDQDRQICDRVVHAGEAQLASETFPFEDARLTELLFRYRARHFPASLSADEEQSWREWVAEKLFCNDVQNDQCLEGYFAILDEFRQGEQLRSDQSQLLEQLHEWGRGLQQKYSKA